MWRTMLEEFIVDFRQQKTRVMLTLISIIWGTMSVVLLLAFGFGLKERMYEGQMGARDNIVTIWSGETSLPYQGLPVGRNIWLNVEDIDLLRENIPFIELISPSQGNNFRVRYGDNRTTTWGEGVAPDFMEMRHMFPRPGGRFINDNDVKDRRRVVFIGDEIAKTLFGDEDPVGSTIELDGLPYTVIGVMIPKHQTSMSNGPDAERVVIPYTTFGTVYNRRSVHQMLVRPSVPDRSQELVRDIRNVLGRKYRFDPTDEVALNIDDDIEMEKIVRKIFLGLNIFFGVIGSLTLVIAGVGVANIMYVVVKERTHELGIRRAIGAKRGHIIMQFLGEAFMITGGGGAIGIGLSLGIIGLVSLVPLDSGVLKYMGHPIFSWPIAMVTVFILMAIAVIAGIFPARQAAEINPVEALRYE